MIEPRIVTTILFHCSSGCQMCLTTCYMHECLYEEAGHACCGSQRHMKCCEQMIRVCTCVKGLLF